MAKDPEFYRRMQEAKERKRKALEAMQLRAEFEVNPDLFLPPIVIKPEAERKMDQAFEGLKAKLKAERGPTEQEKLQQAFDDITRKSQGL